MSFQRTLIASTVLALFLPIASSNAQEKLVVVSANPLGKDETLQILSPTKVLSGAELKSKVGSSLGETLSNELGVTASGFSAGASRPIIRGLEGPRIKILQNGMNVADVSSLSNDHAVASDSASAQQIEILRGPAALLYGSGAIGGLVNVVDDRIPSSLSKELHGGADLKFGSANLEKSGSLFIDGSSGDIAFHFDANSRKTDNYRIPNYATLNDSDSARHILPSSFTNEKSITLGASLIQAWGHVGASLQSMKDNYGIPTEEQSFIDLKQNRFDIDTLINKPFTYFDQLSFKVGATDYQHTEKEQDGTPATNFKNRSTETRISLTHHNWSGWEGNLGIQTEASNYSALSAATARANTVPTTRSQSYALFAVEQKRFGSVVASTGARMEKVERTPETQFQLANRQFQLGSASIGALWELNDGYGIVTSFSTAQRAPTTEELYSNGPHESTATFDIGSTRLKKETSKNLELSLQNTQGQWRWKINLFTNSIQNFVYGDLDGSKVNEEGEVDADGEFTLRHWKQAAATMRGGEAELGFNQYGNGFSFRTFADTSHTKLKRNGYLPLQPANRLGIEFGYKNEGWRANLNIIHAQQQSRLASSESFITPSYTKVDANISYSQPYQLSQVTWFLQAKNLLNEDIRLATSVLKESVPQSKRGLILGIRMSW